MNTHEYEYDEIVIGGSLSSLLYAYHESKPILWVEPRLPYFFDKTTNGESKLEIWKRMAFLLSLSGLAPFGDKVTSYREDDGLLKVFGKEPYFVRVKAKKINYYDEPLVEKENTIFEVVDWINVRRGMCHSYDFLESKTRFVKHVYFYRSDRIEGEHDKKDAVVLSYLKQKQLNDDGYSETYVRLKLLNMMKKAGIHGCKDGFYKGKQRFLSPKIEPVQRDIRICDTKREDQLLIKYNKKDPNHEQLATWADILGEPYE